ncbi:hypothetical protein [Candidatus Electrothrix sp.]|uniref:hypothetical protein n=1 Tax=Candidatus Electrothrix sp. TaxID=2170559 RepID=UPI004055CE93
MQKHQIKPSQPDSELRVRIPHELCQHVQKIAGEQSETLSDLVCIALASYVTTYSTQQKTPTSSTPMELEKARELMENFGRGLDEGTSPHDTARRHDEYLYRK